MGEGGDVVQFPDGLVSTTRSVAPAVTPVVARVRVVARIVGAGIVAWAVVSAAVSTVIATVRRQIELEKDPGPVVARVAVAPVVTMAVAEMGGVVAAVSAKPDLTLSAPEQRRQSPDFLARCAITAFAGRLPLPWPTPPKMRPSPKRHYRSQYRPPNPNRLLALDRAAWATMPSFDLLLLLIDFCGLRPVLAAKLYRPSARGRSPFDPISLFLLFGWQLVNRWDRLEALRHLAEPRYADYAAAFGFRPGVYPTEGGLRYFLTTLGAQNLSDLLLQSMSLIEQAGLIPEETRRKAIVSFDGMLHDAASRLRCSAVQERCYEATSPQTPRPCPAKEKGQRGCLCTEMACRQSCRQAPPRDPNARYVWYSGSNRSDHPNAMAKRTPSPAAEAAVPLAGAPPAKPPHGEGHYGYRSLPVELIDAVQRTTWVLAEAGLAPANGHEEHPAAELLKQTVGDYPWLKIDTAVGDAGLGREPFLSMAYDLGVRRVVDLRADPRTDNDKAGWAIRGYDDRGWPVCPFGHRLHSNGYDEQRQRSKWCCRQRCERCATSEEASAPSAPPEAALRPDCPYRDRADHPLGLIKNVGRAFGDGSLRLVRDVPYGSPLWKEIYRRARNGAEGRNATLQGWGLKRLPVFGTPRAQATICLADLWRNLTTMARLVTEATLAQMAAAAA